MKKRMSREQHIRELVKTDANFRRLYEIVTERNGGRIPSRAEIDRHIHDWRVRRASS